MLTNASSTATTDAALEELLALLEPGAIRSVFQPIVRLADGATIGYEALSRAANGHSSTTPDRWFAEASRLGLSTALELACLRAVATAGPPPDRTLLFVNVSPCSVGVQAVRDLRAALPERLVLELTEQDAIADVEALLNELRRWTAEGVRVALDDVGAGYAGLRQIVQLQPEFLKLDRDLIHGIATDGTRQALVASMVGFSRQVGASIIAEGVETHAELRWLRDAGVSLAQGYYFAHPGAPWPTVVRGRTQPSHQADHHRLAARLGAASTTREACLATADHLFALGGLMPSVYLEAGGRLRCQAQRGLWQVLDGMEPSAGITGRTYRTGQHHHIEDVRAADDYLEAIPGVVAEYCTPIVVEGRVAGALNVESLSSLSDATRAEVDRAAGLLAERLVELPFERSVVSLRRLASTAASLIAVSDPSETARAVVSASCDLTGLDSGAVIAVEAGRGYRVLASDGPLRVALGSTSAKDLVALAQMLEPLSSCYSSGEATGLAFVGGEALRRAGACAVLAIPLVAQGRRTGLLLLANTKPRSLDPSIVEPAELLAALAGSCLETAAHVEDLRSRGRVDALTGLANHAQFHGALRDLPADRSVSLMMFDVDGFKKVNDTYGHLVGDQLLHHMAKRMTKEARGCCDLFRVGGDEVAALVKTDQAHAAMTLAAQLVTAAETALVEHGARLSAGVAIRRLGEDPLETLARADLALYAAKRGGGGLRLG